MPAPTVSDIEAAAKRLDGHVLRTPLLYSRGLSRRSGAHVFLKMESEQISGSFKIRGAFNKILAGVGADKGTVKNPKLHFVTASSGNHGLAVATALEKIGITGTVVLPIYADPIKLAALQSFSSLKVINYGTDVVHAEEQARSLEQKEAGTVFISPYNDELIIAGQGTIGVEMAEQSVDPMSAVFVTVGGGGLISGIAVYLKSRWPSCKIIGCQPEASAVMAQSVEKGYILAEDEVEQDSTLSDGSAGGIEKGSITFPICRQNVDSFVLVSEKEIGETMAYMLDEHKKVIEGAAAVAIASFLKVADQYQGKRVAVVVCGSNVNPEVLFQQHKLYGKHL